MAKNFVDKLKKQFDKFYSHYFSNKSSFERALERYQKKGYDEISSKISEMMKEFEVVADEMKKFFEGKVELSMGVAHDSVKKLRKLYKELWEVSKPEWRQWLESLIIAGILVFVLRNYVFGLYHVPTGSAEPNILVGDRLLGDKLSYLFKDVKRGDLVIFDNPQFIYDRSNLIIYLWQRYIGIGIPILGLKNGPESWVKRVIAVPGDVIEGRIENDKTVVYLNGKKLDEKYVNPYPLIRVDKKVGLINTGLNLGFLDFLRVKYKRVDYTYVPEKSLSDQPYYKLTEDEIYLHPFTRQPVYRWPYTPSYNRYGQNVDSFGPIKLPAGKYWVMGDSRKNSEDSRFWGLLDRSLIHGKASFIIFSVDSEEPFWLFEFIKNPFSFWTKKMRWNRCFKFLNQKDVA